MKIDMTKTYRTRDGREVRIYAVDGGGYYCIHGAINKDGAWRTATWNSEGKYDGGTEHSFNLIEVKPRIQRKVWVNVYPKECGIPEAVYYGRASADGSATVRRIACVEIDIDVEEGHGL